MAAGRSAGQRCSNLASSTCWLRDGSSAASCANHKGKDAGPAAASDPEPAHRAGWTVPCRAPEPPYLLFGVGCAAVRLPLDFLGLAGSEPQRIQWRRAYKFQVTGLTLANGVPSWAPPGVCKLQLFKHTVHEFHVEFSQPEGAKCGQRSWWGHQQRAVFWRDFQLRQRSRDPSPGPPVLPHRLVGLAGKYRAGTA